MSAPLHMAVIGAGPVGLALGLLAAQQLPRASITLFDARPVDRDVSADPRTLALSLGSVQLLQRLGAWPAQRSEPITSVHVSQAPPTVEGAGTVTLTAQDVGEPMLGAVLSYGALVAPLQAAWNQCVQAQPQRLACRFGAPVTELKDLPSGVQVRIAGADSQEQCFDLVVVAEGGVFSEQARKALSHDYRQTAWVGTVVMVGTTPGLAVEHFTRHGPVALLPLPLTQPTLQGQRLSALVWCVPSDDDPLAELDEHERVRLLNSLLPSVAGQVVSIGPLKRFALGLNAERTLVARRQVRIGNAAQTLHPVAGQGLNLGLRDAFALVEALRETGEVEAALRRVEWTRAPDRWSMIATTDFLARSFTWTWPGVALFRGLGLTALQALPPLRRVLARHMMYGRR